VISSDLPPPSGDTSGTLSTADLTNAGCPASGSCAAHANDISMNWNLINGLNKNLKKTSS
jgi:hypothetical protein